VGVDGKTNTSITLSTYEHVIFFAIKVKVAIEVKKLRGGTKTMATTAGQNEMK
jgi:hypothetical protein